MKKIIPVFICLFLAQFCSARLAAQENKDYAKNPVWISMIKDTSANFFEIEKAYATYFNHHEKPSGENDVINERDKKEKYPSKREQRKMQAENAMRIEVKKYEHWRMMMLPYVQKDGHILTPTERLKIYNDQNKLKN